MWSNYFFSFVDVLIKHTPKKITFFCKNTNTFNWHGIMLGQHTLKSFVMFSIVKKLIELNETSNKICWSRFSAINRAFVFLTCIYRVFHGFGQTEFPDNGSALDSSQFSILPQLHQKTILPSKGAKTDSKIRNSCR